MKVKSTGLLQYRRWSSIYPTMDIEDYRILRVGGIADIHDDVAEPLLKGKYIYQIVETKKKKKGGGK